MKRELIFLILIIAFAIFSRIYRLWEPPTYMFDEVYHAFTAVELEKGNKMAWEWWNTPPQGFAYEWTHPPLAKEFMVLGIKMFACLHLPSATNSQMSADGRQDPNPFAWRFPGALFGVGVIYLIYLLGKELFNERVGLIASFLASIDGLIFVQSRIGMNDTYFLFFMLLAFYFFIRYYQNVSRKFTDVSNRAEVANEIFSGTNWPSFLKNLLAPRTHKITELSKIVGRQPLHNPSFWMILTGISLGLSLASKWTALYGIGIIGILGGLGILNTLRRWGKREILRAIYYLLSATIIIPVIIYLVSYIPFFTSGHTWAQFNELQHQIWWYHTNLKATHPYQSLWYTWPLMYRPVWFYVKYGIGEIANVYTMGNPLIWWAGIVAICFAIWELLRSLMQRGIDKLPAIPIYSLLVILFGYFGFILPWARSPRIMFLYHYLPSVPFMCLALGYGLNKIWEIGLIGKIGQIKITGKVLALCYLLSVLIVFIYFYPHLSGLSVPTWLNDSYYWFKSWK
ncbi:MAG: phospholipid carrier-dependent glycosyltransferase [Candidatus Gottesmanbacteria bacterium]